MNLTKERINRLGPLRMDNKPNWPDHGTIKVIKPMTTFSTTVAKASDASSTPKIEFNSCAETCVIRDYFLVTHKNNRPIFYCYGSKDGYKSTKMVNAATKYNDLHSR